MMIVHRFARWALACGFMVLAVCLSAPPARAQETQTQGMRYFALDQSHAAAPESPPRAKYTADGLKSKTGDDGEDVQEPALKKVWEKYKDLAAGTEGGNSGQAQAKSESKSRAQPQDSDQDTAAQKQSPMQALLGKLQTSRQNNGTIHTLTITRPQAPGKPKAAQAQDIEISPPRNGNMNPPDNTP